MSRNKYQEMAARINAMKPGMAWRIPGHEIRDLPGLPDWAAFADITIGFDRVKESVMGSAIPGLWQFHDEPNGDITVYRYPEKREDGLQIAAGSKWSADELRQIGQADVPLAIGRLGHKAL